MKQYSIILLFSFFSIAFFNSCDADVEPVDPALLVTPPAGCSSPSFLNVSALIAGNTVSIIWDEDSGSAWEVQYGPHGFAIGTGTTVNFTSTSSLINGLDASVSYDFYMRTKCSADSFSSWIGPVAPGENIEVCVDPVNVTAVRSATDATKATVSWTAGSASNWEIQYGPVGFAIGTGTVEPVSTPSKIIMGLVPANAYQVYVRTLCASDNSNWVGPISINATGSSTCTTPSGLTAVRNLGTQAVLNWTAGGSEASWEIKYGVAGFNVAGGTPVLSTTTTKTITGLGTGAYDFYIRAKCTATQNSNWFGPINMAAVSTSGVDSSPPMMTANIAGTQYNHMQPFMYPLSFSVQVTNQGSEPDIKFLWIQGDTSNDLAITKEINLYIPESMWHTGTYSLTESDNMIDGNYCQVHMIHEVAAGPITSIQVLSGTITVTEFNTVTRRIKGTFSMSYNKEVDDVDMGNFQVTNGTFNYYLDADYFD